MTGLRHEVEGKLSQSDFHAAMTSSVRHMYGAIMGQFALLLGVAYFFVSHVQRYPQRCTRGATLSVAEIVELQRHVELRAAQQRDRRLQLIALLAAHPHLVALQTALHLELGVLDEAHDLSAGVLIDAVPQHHFLARGREAGLRLLHLEAREVDAALGEAQLEDLQHLRSEERRVGKECRSRWSPY